MSEKYKYTYRGYLCDHHSPDPPAINFDKMSAEECERFLKEGNIDHVMVYCKDHWGSSYYNTEIGRKHPALGDRDWIREIKPVLEKLNIEFTAYYCFEYDNYIPQVHPEWSSYTKDGIKMICGMPDNSANAKWGMPCLETGYREYCLGQLKEIIRNYHPDSLFIDIFGKSLCYCDTCRKKFKERYQMELPEKEDEMIRYNKQIAEFLDDESEELLDEVNRELKAIDPTLAVTVNFSSHYRKSTREKLDYMYTEPWAGNWLSGAYTRDTSCGRYPQLGPGNVSQIFNYQPDSIYELAAAEIAAQDCHVFMYSESMRTDGSLEFEEAARIGKAYREVEKYQPYLGNRTVHADIAILQSDLSDTLKVTKPIPMRSVSRTKVSGKHRESLLGAMKLCDYSKLSWCLVPETELTLEKMREFKAILITAVAYIDDQTADNLETYAKEGGKIFISGETGICDMDGQDLGNFRLSSLMGISLKRKNDDYQKNPWTAYIAPEASAIWKNTPRTTPPVIGTLLDTEINEKEDVKILGNFVNPAVALTPTTWLNWGSPQPGLSEGYPALTEHAVGKGKVLTCCFDFFGLINHNLHWTKEFFCDTMKYLFAPSVEIETEYKNTLEFACYERASGEAGKKELLLHELSASARLSGGDTPEIPGGKLILRMDGFCPEGAEQVYPEKEMLPLVQREDGSCEISLKPLKIHRVYRITGKTE